MRVLSDLLKAFGGLFDQIDQKSRDELGPMPEELQKGPDGTPIQNPEYLHHMGRRGIRNPRDFGSNPSSDFL